MNKEIEQQIIQNIKNVSSKYLSKTVEPTYIGKGSKTYVYKIDENWVIKLNTQDKRYLSTEKELINICVNNGIKAPRIDLIGAFTIKKAKENDDPEEVNVNYGFQELVVGNELTDDLVTKNIVIQLGKDLKNLHKINMRGFGRLDLQTSGPHTSWREYLFTNIKEEYTDLTHQELPDITEHVINFVTNVSLEKSKFCFGDLKYDHVVIENGKYKQLVDFDYSLAGDPMYDFAVYDFYCDFFNKNKSTKKWIRYKNVDEDLILEYKRVIALKKYGVYKLRDTEKPEKAGIAKELLTKYFK